MSTPTVTAFGTRAALVRVRDVATARTTASHLRRMLGAQAISVVPGADTVLAHAAADVSVDRLMATVRCAVAVMPRARVTVPKTVHIPVRYTGEDLHDVASLLGVSADEVVTRHTNPDYEVAFLGFAPGFAYLTGLDPFLVDVPRLDSPRTRVPAGSVGLAAGKTCVYPSASPGGWRLLGSTDTVLFDPTNEDSPAFLSPGDLVRFAVVR